MKEHGDRRGARRLRRSSLTAVIQPPRRELRAHMTPTLLASTSGWIYENNIASQVLMKKGVFWSPS